MEVSYTVVWAASCDIDQSINKLRENVGRLTIKGYKLQGGVSIAISPDGRFYATQTLYKEREENG